ncbi:hypothetical protein CNMCM6106_008021 [Aspergillus hiratsukae]|uniref:Ubiquitin-like protease family profile domain-containing protein n=1 Tax=Aspergillus hiratsukae TaxID=1194566 RepID=A0A8H6V1C0_9EURO|nr:hypothetical protein CNMCM6106_008021 [Aspergillus hiratsukae]
MLSNSIDQTEKAATALDEVIDLLRVFVRKVVTCAPSNLRDAPEFNSIMQQLCKEAPQVAQAIAGAIQEEKISLPKLQGPVLRQATHSSTRKRSLVVDSSRPSKYAKRKVECYPGYADGSDQQPDFDTVQKNTTSHAKEQARGNEEPLDEGNRIRVVLSAPPDSLQDDTRDGTLGVYIARKHQCRKLGDGTPASETAFKELILSLVKTIYELCNCPGGPPQAACQSILQSLQKGRFGELSEWSDGASWMRMLDMGSSQQNKVTVSNMLMYIGLWEWFDQQVNYVQDKIRTKKNKLMGEKAAKTHVLNEMQNSLQDSGPQPAAQEKWFSRVGMVTLEENACGILPRDGLTSMTSMAKIQQRSRISTLLHRGKWLSTKLVKELGRGILLHPKIWDYTKMSEEKLDDWIKKTKDDFKQKELWEILGPQLDRLVEKGSPDLQAFYKDLRKKQLVTEEEIDEMNICYPLDSDALPEGKLEDAVTHLKKLVSSKVLGKDTLDKTDNIAVDGSMDLTCDIFDRLYPTKWLDSWTIYLAMKISDKPPYVRFDTSVLLEYQPEKDKKIKKIKKVTSDSLDCQLIEIKKTTPLAEWAKKIAEDQRRAEEKLIHFRPINYRKHFTLLEINTREGVIRHYDSLADRGIKETEISRLVKKEFSSFGFRYEEAETPRQLDDWSCGIRVIWNFRRLCNGIPIGSWSQRLNPEPMLLEIVEDRGNDQLRVPRAQRLLTPSTFTHSFLMGPSAFIKLNESRSLGITLGLFTLTRDGSPPDYNDYWIFYRKYALEVSQLNVSQLP